MRKDTSNVNISSKKGITLVELIVSMTLLMLFTVVCISLINPIERIYQHTVKLSHAQLIADTVVDSIRKECDDVDNSDESSVWIANGSKDGNVSNLFNGPVSGVYVDPDDKGSVLVMRKNGNYCEAIFSCFEITKDNLEAVSDTGMTGTTYGHAATSLLDDSNKQNRQSGYVHFGYYQLKENDKGVTPFKAYDYTNPLTVSTYEGYTISLSFEGLEYKTDEDGVKHPTFVKLTVNVYEGDYSNPSNKRIYSRNTIVSFSPNGSGKGTHGGGGNTPSTLKDIAVRVKWVDEAGNTTSWPDAATVPGVTITFNGSEPHRTYTLANGLNSFVFANVKVTGDKTLTCSDLSPEYSYTYSGNPNSGYVVTYRHDNVKTVKLLCGTEFIKKIDQNNVTGVVFGRKSEWIDHINSSKASGAKVYGPYDVAIPYDAAYDSTATQDDYVLYRVSQSGSVNVYVLSKDGRFVLNESCKKMFINCRKLTSITGFTTDDSVNSIFSTELTTSMHSMFEGCEKITSFELEGLVSSKVTTTFGMFKNCSGAVSCDMTGWNTSGVTTMESMFLNFGCKTDRDITIDIGRFSFENCTSLKQMFASDNNGDNKSFNPSKVSRIKEVYFPELDSSSTSKITTIESMFSNCERLVKVRNFLVNADTAEIAESLSVPHVSFNAVTNTDNLFYGCLGLKNVRLRIDLPACASIKQLFAHCDSLKSADLSKSDFSGMTALTNFFWYCNNMEKVKMNEINLKSFTGSSTTMFEQCYGLTWLEIIDSDLRSVTNAKFFTRDSLHHLDLTRTKLWGMTSCKSMFAVINPQNKKELRSVVIKDTELINCTSYESMFMDCLYLTTVEFSPKLSSSVSTINCSSMFKNCPELASVDLSGWDTSKVTSVNCQSMFESCSKLDMDIGSFAGWNTSGITNMKYMFKNCPKLGSSLDGVISLNDLNFSSCTTMQECFYGCTALKKLKFNGVNLKSCSTYTDLIAECPALTDVEIIDSDLTAAPDFVFLKPAKNIDLSRSTFGMASLASSFKDSSIETIRLNGTHLTYCTTAKSLFSGCNSLVSADLSGIDAPKLENCSYMFQNCTGLTSYIFENVTLNACTDISYMFNGCSELITVQMSGFTAPLLTNCQSLFENCTKLDIGVGNFAGWSTSSVTNMSYIFKNCTSLGSNSEGVVSLSSMVLSSCTTMREAFYGCTSLKKLKLNEIHLEACSTYTDFVKECTSLTDVEIIDSDLTAAPDFVFLKPAKNIDLSRSTFGMASLASSFKDSSIETIRLNGTHLTYCTTAKSLFSGCNSLVSADLSGIDAPKLENCSYMFQNCTGLTSYIFENVTLNACTDISYMFNGCSELITVQMSGFTAPLLTNCQSLFENCTKLDIGVGNFAGWSTSSVTNMSYIFKNCTSLGSNSEGVVSLSSMVLSSCTTMREAFYGCTSLKKLKLNEIHLEACSTYTDFVKECTSLTDVEIVDSYLNAAPNLSFLSSVNNIDLSGSTFGMNSLASSFINSLVISTIKLNGTHFPNCTSFKQMFQGCKKLTSVEMINLDTPELTTCESMFQDCYSLSIAEGMTSGWNSSSVTNVTNMFYNACYKGDANFVGDSDAVIDISGLKFTNISNFTQMFWNYKDTYVPSKDVLKKIVLPSGSDAVTNAASVITNRMFNCREHLTEIKNLNCFGLGENTKVTNANSTFARTGLTIMDISGFDLNKITGTADWIFNQNHNVTTIYVHPRLAETNTFATKSSDKLIFEDCNTNLVGQNETRWENKKDKMKYSYGKVDKPGSPGYFSIKTD